METAAEFDEALAAAFASKGPAVIEVETDATPSGMFGGQPARMTGEPGDNPNDLGAGDIEQALTMLAWGDPSVVEDPAALSQLGVDVPAGLRFDVRVQRPDTLYLVIPSAYSDDGEHEGVVNQMDLWRSGDQFVWIMPQDAKVALLQMREQYRNRVAEEGP